MQTRSLVAACFLICFLSSSSVICSPASGAPTVSIELIKRFGFAAFGDMSGSFTAIASVSADIVRVEFYLDNQLMLNDTAPPFQWEFDTSNYSLAQHTFKVMAYDNLGESVDASREANFVEGPFPPYFAVILALFLILAICAVVYGAIVGFPKQGRLKKSS